MIATGQELQVITLQQHVLRSRILVQHELALENGLFFHNRVQLQHLLYNWTFYNLRCEFEDLAAVLKVEAHYVNLNSLGFDVDETHPQTCIQSHDLLPINHHGLCFSQLDPVLLLVLPSDLKCAEIVLQQ